MFKNYIDKIVPEILRAILNQNHLYASFSVTVKAAGKKLAVTASGTTGTDFMSQESDILFTRNLTTNAQEKDFIADFKKVVSSNEFVMINVDERMLYAIPFSQAKFKKRNLIAITLHTIERSGEPMKRTRLVLMGVEDNKDATEVALVGDIQIIHADTRPYVEQGPHAHLYEELETPWKAEYGLSKYG